MDSIFIKQKQKNKKRREEKIACDCMPNMAAHVAEPLDTSLIPSHVAHMRTAVRTHIVGAWLRSTIMHTTKPIPAHTILRRYQRITKI